jgi:2-iminobutanoate/2-iminopropanoate deaminase
MKKSLSTENAPKPIAPYSQSVLVNGMLFVSGQIPVDPKTNEIVNGIEAQATQVMENIKAILNDAGLTMSNIVKASIFLSDMDNFSKVNDIYASYFKSNFPARECIQAARLPKDVGVEISVIAFV